MKEPNGKTKKTPTLLREEAYVNCFRNALGTVIKLKPGGYTKSQLNRLSHDSRLSDSKAADSDFYPGFEFRSNGVMVYTLTRSFLDHSLQGLEIPSSKRKRGESEIKYMEDCATNYLVKNFWHNIVHEQMQRITSHNYREFREEARYSSDFDADCLATVMLALSYGHTARTDKSSQVATPNVGLQQLFLRNRCNTAFALREESRDKVRNKRRSWTLDDLVEAEWLIRRRLVNELCMRCLERGRTLSSVSVHFYGAITRGRGGRYERKDARGAVVMNGIHIPMKHLGDFAYAHRDKIKNAVHRYVEFLDTTYAEALRTDLTLRAYAHDLLLARLRRLVSRRLFETQSGIRMSGLRVAT